MMRHVALAAVLLTASASLPAAAEPMQATLYKNPQCGCCQNYAAYMEDNGFEVTVVATHDMSLINQEHGVPVALEGCHTTLVDGYVVGGHVPVEVLNRLLTERPDIRGISLPGMPMGSPGMLGEQTEPFVIYELGDGESVVYATE